MYEGEMSVGTDRRRPRRVQELEILKRDSNEVYALWSVTEPNQNKKEQESEKPDQSIGGENIRGK